MTPTSNPLVRWLTESSPISENAPAWEELVQLASSQGLAGLALGSPAGGRAPAWVQNALQSSASSVASQNLHALSELSRVARAFAAAGVRTMALKGAALNLTVYPRLDLRPMSDLDLLVSPKDAAQAVGILESIGYRCGAALIRDDFFPKHHYERELILPGSQPVRIDLHAHPWRPMHLAQIVSHESFWADAVALPLDDGHIFIPGPATMFIHLAAHAAFHDCSRLIWLYDMKCVADHYGSMLDWSHVINRARHWQLTLAVRTAVARTRTMFGEVCPPDVSRNLTAANASWRAHVTHWHTPRDASSPLLHVACNLLCLRGFGPRAAYLHALLMPGKKHLAESYAFRHAGWIWCAQAMRALRAFGRVLAALPHLLRISFSPHTQGASC